MDVKLCDLCHTKINGEYMRFEHRVDDGRYEQYTDQVVDLHNSCLTILRSGRLATYVSTPPPPKVD